MILTLWQKILESTLTSLITVVLIGFFALLWKSTSSYEDRIHHLEHGLDDLVAKLTSLQESSTKEFAGLQVKMDEAIKPLTNKITAVSPVEILEKVRAKEDALNKRFFERLQQSPAKKE
jgi:hypothetical protein